jgi:uncharacterized phage protein (TIGR02218 family)
VKTIAAALQTHYDSSSTTIATLWKVTRADSTVYGFTDHDQALVYGGLTYSPTSVFDASAIETRGQLNVDNLELVGLLDSAGITEADIEAGLWDGAQIEVREVNWASLTDGANLLRVGSIGKVSRRRGQYVAEMRGLMQSLQNNIGRIVHPSCDADLGDARCGVALGPLTITGAVTGVTSRRVFADTSLVQAADYFTGGLVTWTSGACSGLAMEVKTFALGGGVTLHLPGPYDIAIGDDYTITPGCDKLKATCIAKFSNVVNFRGFSFVPGQDQVLLVGGQ